MYLSFSFNQSDQSMPLLTTPHVNQLILMGNNKVFNMIINKLIKHYFITGKWI